MKKRICLLVAMMLLVAASASALTVSGENEFPLADEKVTLSVWVPDNNLRDHENCLMTTTLEEKMNIEFDFQLPSVDGKTYLNLMLAEDKYPDLMLGSGFTTAQINMCVERGALLPLNDLIEKYGYNFRKALEENPMWKKMMTAPDGNIYTFMYTDTGVHKASEYKMWYKQSWLDALNMEAPTTTQEFKDFLIAIRDNDVNGNGDPNDEIPMVGYYGGRRTDPICFLMNPFELYTDNYYHITDDGEIYFEAITDGWREGLKYIADLYKEGLIDEATYVQDGTQFKALLNKPADEAIVGVFPAWYQGAEIDTKVLDWTDYEALAPIQGNFRQTAARLGGSFGLLGGISTQCENPEVAFKLLDYLIGEEGTYLGWYGVEGISYEWIDKPSFYGGEKSISRLMREVDVCWNSCTFPRWDREDIRFATTLDESQRLVDNTYILVHAAQIYEPYYVNHNTPDIIWCDDEEVTTAVSEYSVVINEYVKATDTQFVMGVLDINDDAVWQNYIDQLYKMGLEDYIAKLAIYYGLK